MTDPPTSPVKNLDPYKVLETGSFWGKKETEAVGYSLPGKNQQSSFGERHDYEWHQWDMWLGKLRVYFGCGVLLSSSAI